MSSIIARPLEHEGVQIGYLIECPNCQIEIRVPVFEFLADQPAELWQVPPQNTDLAEGGWYHAWGTHAPDASGLDLRQPGGRGEMQAQAEHRLVCQSCGRSYAVTEGEIVERE